MDETTQSTGRQEDRLIRIGGLAVLVALAIHIFVNGFLKKFPPENPSLPELKDYLTVEASTWAIVHGLKYLALVGLVVFAAAVYSRTCRSRRALGAGWGVVGLLGTAIHVTNAMIANGIEIMAFYDFTLLSEEASLFWLLFRTVRVLFTAEIVAWGVVIFGFSMAGFQSSLGFFSATACMVSGVFVVSVLTEGWATILIDVASITGLAWFSCVGVYMLMQGES